MPIKTVIAVATYKKNEYQELLACSEDADNMDATWEEWTNSKNKALKNLKKVGLQVEEVPIKVPDLVLFCRENGLKVNGASRAKYAQKLAEGK